MICMAPEVQMTQGAPSGTFVGRLVMVLEAGLAAGPETCNLEWLLRSIEK